MTVDEIVSKRASDSPSRLVVPFVLLYVVAVIWYSITRRNWSVLVITLSSLILQSLVFSVVESLALSLLSLDLADSAPFVVLDYLAALLTIAISSYLSIKHVVRLARGGDSRPGVRAARAIGAALSRPFIRFPKRYRRKRVLFVLLFVPVFGYALFTIGVESSIKSNPILAEIQASGTRVNIRHFNCGDAFGTYDVASDSMNLCLSSHGRDLVTSKEATIRHEAWHVVQACSTLTTKDDEWGGIAPVKPGWLAGKSLSADERQFIEDNYPPEDWSIEQEAFLAEHFLADYQIIESIKKYCYFDG